MKNIRIQEVPMSGYRLIKEHYDDLLELLDCIRVGIYIGDGNGKTIFMNKESEKTGGLSREEVIGKSMAELIRMGYVEESSILKAIESRTEENIIQELGEGGQLYITGVPVVKNGKVELVICTERDITETINLKELLKEKEEIAEKYESELQYHRNRTAAHSSAVGEIISESFEMKNVKDKALRASRHGMTVLLTGESGTGKEIIANLIYEKSSRKGEAFIKVNCAAIPDNLLESEFFGYEQGSFTGASKEGKKGIFELADQGTLFLDEVGELPIQMQSKLLRALQEKEIMRIGGKETIPVDVRIIAATNRNLKDAIAAGEFREDLFYRLNIFPIDIPPLRVRKADIGKLAEYFVDKFNKDYKVNKEITDDALCILENYAWPGNVRELRNVIERIVVGFDGTHINRFQVQGLLGGSLDEKERHKECYNGTLEELMDNYEKEILTNLMAYYKKAADVARILNVNKSTISRKFKKYHIE